MKIKFTVKIKDKHNPPTFNEELGKGVLKTVVVDYKQAPEEYLEEPIFARAIFEKMEELKDDMIEVIPEIIKK